MGIGELAAGLRGESLMPDRPVAITFDDGYDDTMRAIDALCERRLRATVYVTTGQIGDRSMIGHNELKLLAERPEAIELGAHSISHPRLDELSPAGIEREVLGSKGQLEQLTGLPVSTFAYPHGAYDWRVRQAVIAAGFRSAAAVKNALSHSEDDSWAIARWTVRGSTTAPQIVRVLEGAGVPRAWRRERVRTRGYRAARKLRRRLPHALGRSC
jgi:peptidoglycan/xylan/chitin deacetylase (PgdA/CDA1 family)